MPPTLVQGDALDHYDRWPTPTVIVSDGAYGVAGFPGDPPTHRGLVDWYAPHVAAWSRRAQPLTTLWFWGTELGFATVHPLLEAHGWEYRACNVWDKGLAHIAGNANTRTLRKFPVVTEVCVHYVRQHRVPVAGASLELKQWLRHEWHRAGLALGLSNDACGVKNAATRKYFTQCHLWYFPPPEAFEALARFANERGLPEGRPYFSFDGERPVTGDEWAKLRAKFHCEVGVTNVWSEPAVRGKERVKRLHRAVHGNQKPLELMRRILRAASDPGDVVWDPFAGLGSLGVVAVSEGRRYFGTEISREFWREATRRIGAGDARAAGTSRRHDAQEILREDASLARARDG